MHYIKAFFLKGSRKTETNGSLKLEALTSTALFIGLQYLAIRNTGCTFKFLFHINRLMSTEDLNAARCSIRGLTNCIQKEPKNGGMAAFAVIPQPQRHDLQTLCCYYRQQNSK